MNVEENQKVRSGEVLAEIDPQDYHNTLLQIENEMGSIEAKTQNAEKEFKRVSSLFRKGVVSQQQYDTSETTWKELTRKLNSFHSQVSQARLNLSYTQIKAPSEGVVAKKVAEQGMLAPIGTPLFGFVSSEGRWVVANFKETQLLQIKPGKQVEVKVDAIPNQTFFGIVESISPSTGATFALLPPDNASGNFTKVIQRVPVRIKLINLSAENIDQLQVGLSASVFVKIRS
jgi:membrane fusion protein (multidrug efflux system)